MVEEQKPEWYYHGGHMSEELGPGEYKQVFRFDEEDASFEAFLKFAQEHRDQASPDIRAALDANDEKALRAIYDANVKVATDGP